MFRSPHTEAGRSAEPSRSTASRLVHEAIAFVGGETLRDRVTIDGEAANAWCDGALVQRVIVNLVSNAIRLSRNHDPIAVHLSTVEERVTVAIEIAGRALHPRTRNGSSLSIGRESARPPGHAGKAPVWG
jgi:K+-sensing histidine kinase KdpD